MATVTQMVSRTRTRYHKDQSGGSISDTVILKYLNEAQDMIESRILLPAAQTNTTLSLVADQQEYTLDSGLIKIALVRYQTDDRVLVENNVMNIQKRYADASGTPYEYYIWGNKIGFDPVPSGSESNAIKYWYIKRLDELVESDAGAGQVTTSEVPEGFHWVVERGAEMLMSQETGHLDRAQQAEIKFEQGIAEMKNTYNTSSYNMDTTLFTEEQLTGERNFRFDPYIDA